MSKHVTIITVTYNSAAMLPRWIAAVQRQTFTDFDVIVVDNASETGQRPAASALPDRFSLIQNEQNRGFAAANNQAVAVSAAPLIAFLNPDAFPEPGWLATLVQAADARPDFAAFGSTQLIDTDRTRLDGAGDVWHAAGIPYRGGFEQPATQPYPDGPCFAPCAAAALWRRDAFEALGGFEERFFAYCEDVDLGFRLRLSGGQSYQCGAAIVAHMGSGVTGRRSVFTVRLGTRNRLWTFVRCVPGWLLWVTLPLHGVATLILWAKAARNGAGAAYGQGLREGLAGLNQTLAERARIQSARRTSTRQIAASFAWKPQALLTRAVHLLNRT